jgi:hypothetical protein
MFAEGVHADAHRTPVWPEKLVALVLDLVHLTIAGGISPVEDVQGAVHPEQLS